MKKIDKTETMLKEVNEIIAIKKSMDFTVQEIIEINSDRAEILFTYPSSKTKLRVVNFDFDKDEVFTHEYDSLLVHK